MPKRKYMAKSAQVFGKVKSTAKKPGSKARYTPSGKGGRRP